MKTYCQRLAMALTAVGFWTATSSSANADPAAAAAFAMQHPEAIHNAAKAARKFHDSPAGNAIRQHARQRLQQNLQGSAGGARGYSGGDSRASTMRSLIRRRAELESSGSTRGAQGGYNGDDSDRQALRRAGGTAVIGAAAAAAARRNANQTTPYPRTNYDGQPSGRYSQQNRYDNGTPQHEASQAQHGEDFYRQDAAGQR